MKYVVVENSKILDDVIKFLIEETSLPSIQRRLNIYSADDDGESQVMALNNKVFFRDSTTSKYTFVKNKNLKYFFKHVERDNKNGFFINDIVMLKFPTCNLLFDTFHGNIISTEDEDIIKKISKKFKLTIYNNINDHKEVYKVEPEPIFDKIGNLNAKIKNYAIKTGLDIRSSSSSIRLRLSNLSNDYSHIEKFYKLITGGELLQYNTNHVYENKFENISIIIPVYNQNVIPTLLSIQSQNISKENKAKIQVILVDDGSKENVYESVKHVLNKLDYEVNVITLCNNMGISNARNAGLAIAKHKLLLFMDSDIILSKDYIYDINIRLQLVPNAIFVAMRKNIEKDDKLTTDKVILKGVDPCLDYDDSRVVTRSKEYHIGWDKAFKDDVVSILDDSDCFKQLGFGSKIGIYNLSTVVTGHNMAINRELITKYPVFSNRFTGWGMDDSYFASSLISNGCFVIPVLSSSVYHINHPPRSGSMEQKRKEAARNFELYNKMLDEEWEE